MNTFDININDLNDNFLNIINEIGNLKTEHLNIKKDLDIIKINDNEIKKILIELAKQQY